MVTWSRALARVKPQCYSAEMTKLLEKAIAKVRELPEEEQDALAAALLAMTGEEPSTIRLDEVTRAAVREGLAQAERGEFVADEIVAEADKRHGV